MTKKEHEMMILMFARINQRIGMIVETLKSRNVWTGDDEKAFAHLVYADDSKILSYASQARSDYLACARESSGNALRNLTPVSRNSLNYRNEIVTTVTISCTAICREFAVRMIRPAEKRLAKPRLLIRPC
jgi:hypothetical protein